MVASNLILGAALAIALLGSLSIARLVFGMYAVVLRFGLYLLAGAVLVVMLL